jgi:two-component system sporulation sensor kinase C
MEKEKVPRQERGKLRGRATGKNVNDPYAQIVEKAAHAIFVVQDGRLRFANSRARDFLRQPIEKLNPEDLAGFVHPDDRAMVLGHYERRLRGEEVPKIYSFRLVDDQGQARWAEASVNLIDWDGRPATLVLAEDITPRKRMEMALRRSEEAARRLAGEKAAMAEITRIISSSLNIDEVYERFAEEMRKLLDFENLTVVTMKFEESSVTVTYVAGVPVPGGEVGTVIPLEGTSAEEVYKTRSSLFIQKENLAEAVRKMPKLGAAFKAGIQSMIVVPLISEGRVIGILNFLSTRPDAYTRADLEIAERVSAQISGAIANAQLFQELNHTLEALKESELRNRGLVEAAGISGLGIVVFQGEKRREVVCEFANQEAQRITGYTEEELRRTPFLQIIHPAHRKTASSRYWTRVQGDQEPVLYPLVIRHKKGRKVLIEISTIRTIFHGKESMIGFFRDTSERRRTEEALRESEAKFRALVHNAGDMIFLHLLTKEGKPGRFIEVNDLACQKLEYTREELLARTPGGITLEYEEVSPSILQQVATAAKGPDGQSRVTCEAVLMTKGGTRIPAEISFETFVLKGQKVGLAIARDITERKRTETELADYRAHLEQRVEERTARIHQLEQQRGEIEKMAATGVLAARIAHEINNPLAGIKGAFMLIQEAIPPGHRYHRYVVSIHQEINRIARIVRQMFELYRPPEEAREELPIDRMIQDVAALLNPECRDRKVSFQLDLSPTKVRLPAGPVRQALFNIMKNAVEASPFEGAVKVSARERGEGAAIQVHDEGPGIPEANRPHVFKPFFTTKAGPQKGLGLGLSISHDIVKNLGGSIRFTSPRGGGTIFQITLPGKEKKKKG